ncbi:unnamed protein product [Closterium sp. NIES-53]
MTSLRVLAFDHEGRPIQFDTWLDDLQPYLQSNSRDSVSLFDHTSGAAPAPPATAESATRSQWLTPALGRLLLPYLFPELSAFATVEDLVSHLRTSVARYYVALPAEFLATNPPPMSGLLLLVGSAAAARARVAGVVAVAAGVVVGAALEVVEAVEVVAVVEVEAGVGALVAAVVAPVGVAVVVAVGVVAVGLELLSRERGASGGSGSCPYVIRTGDRAGQTCGKPHTQHRYFSRLDDAWRSEFGDEAERPRWAELLRYGVAIFDLDYDAILAAMYALSVSAEGDCYVCVPPDPGIEAATLGASESTLPGTATAKALHTFTLDSGASCCFFRDSTTLTPLSAPKLVRLAYPSGGPVLAHSSTVLPCLAVRSGSLSGLHLPSFSTNLHVYMDGPSPGHVHSLAWVESVHTSYQASSGSCVCPRVRVRSGSTPLLVSPLVAPESPVAPPPWSPVLATPLWHALSPPCLWSSQVFACLPCIEGWQRAAPHSSFPPTSAPLQTLHMDVWGPARISGQSRERYFLLVVDHCTRYITVFPLRSKGEDLAVLRLHSDKGGEFSSDLLRYFCRGEGITESFSLPDSLQKNGIAEHRIGLAMEVARTSMIDAAGTGQVVTFDESVPFYCLFPYRSTPPPPLPLFLAPGPPPLDPLPPQGPAPSGVSQVDPLPCTVSVEVAVSSGAARGAAPGGAEPGGAKSEGAGSGGVEPGGVEPGGAEPAGVEPGGAKFEGAESEGAEPRGTASSGDLAGV